jgi:lathosterol oxidase
MAEPPDHRRPHVSLETTEPTLLGSGFASGLISAILGIAGFGAVLCLRFPEYLTHSSLRPLYSLEYLRAIIHVTLVASFLLGTVSAFLRANKTLALTGIGFTLAAALLGGSQVPVATDLRAHSWLGLDFFVLNLMLYSAVFIPLERLFARRVDQPVFRRQWVVDLTYFFINSLLI